MIHRIIKMDGYWTVDFYADVDYEYYDDIEVSLYKIECPIKEIDNIYNNINNLKDSGVTYTNPRYRTSVVCINKTTTKYELIDTIAHEADHVQDAICDYYKIPLDSEDAAYLIGYLVKCFYKACSKLFR